MKQKYSKLLYMYFYFIYHLYFNFTFQHIVIFFYTFVDYNNYVVNFIIKFPRCKELIRIHEQIIFHKSLLNVYD